MQIQKPTLSSYQVSAVLSSVIVVCFTAIIFLLGVIWQQRSIEGLHNALRPRPISPDLLDLEPEIDYGKTAVIKPANRWQWMTTYFPFSTANDSKSKVQPFAWSRLAYAQIAQHPSDVCNALIIFADLHRAKSPVPRLLVFPQKWMLASTDDDTDIALAQRLLKKASRRYRAILVPLASKSNDSTLSSLDLHALVDYDLVTTLPTPGLVVNAEQLDSMLARRLHASSDVAIHVPSKYGIEDSKILVVKPSMKTHENQVKGSDERREMVASAPSSSAEHGLLTTSYTLRTSTKPFNATAFQSATAFIHLTDPDFPGPEYDVPYEEIVKSRPKDSDRAFVWERMDSTYKDHRYRVCGLDLLDLEHGRDQAQKEREREL